MNGGGNVEDKIDSSRNLERIGQSRTRFACVDRRWQLSGRHGDASTCRARILNLAPGLVSTTDVLRVLVDVIPIEGAAVMEPGSGKTPGIFREFRSLLPKGITIEPMTRIIFYEAARREDTALVIATGEQRTFANILLTIGVVK
jgi:L-fucose mutarotase/ribose pyranase (RbsD/FucU family)